jgi:hypothetical protein
MTKTEAMFAHVFVRRAGVGARPFTWEIHGDGITPLHVSVSRYATMHAAYEAGQAELAARIAPVVQKLPQMAHAPANEVHKLAA